MLKVHEAWFDELDLSFVIEDVYAPEGLCCTTKIMSHEGCGLGFRMFSHEPEQALLIGMLQLGNSVLITRENILSKQR